MMLTVMIDTNVIISSAINPGGKAAASMMKALAFPYQPVVCDYIVDELHRKFQEKFPDRIPALEEFLDAALQLIKVVPTPTVTVDKETEIRDVKDRPILRAALDGNIDILLTGDKDFP